MDPLLVMCGKCMVVIAQLVDRIGSDKMALLSLEEDEVYLYIN